MTKTKQIKKDIICLHDLNPLVNIEFKHLILLNPKIYVSYRYQE